MGNTYSILYNGLVNEKLEIYLEICYSDNSWRPISNIISFPARDKPKELNNS